MCGDAWYDIRGEFAADSAPEKWGCEGIGPRSCAGVQRVRHLELGVERGGVYLVVRGAGARRAAGEVVRRRRGVYLRLHARKAVSHARGRTGGASAPT